MIKIESKAENLVMDGFAEATKDLIEAAARAYRRGIQTGSGGNLSVRIPGKDWMLVKPSGISFIDCNEKNLVVTDFDGKVVAGSGKPSREALLHGVLYRHLPSIGGVVHCHSPGNFVVFLETGPAFGDPSCAHEIRRSHRHRRC